jgi:ribA/ribD-fused uncharacterized protein
MSKIERFVGEHEFLSNFYPCEITFEGKNYPTSEHAFQAAKTLSEEEREKIRFCKTPGSAKAAGKKVTLRRNWDFERTSWMEMILRKKFENPELRKLLLATGSQELVEGNSWGDKFWGVCRGQGQNRLGKILMKIRADLQKTL